MKFIFPQNYNFRNKLFGMFDYSTILFNLIWDVIIFLIINFIFNALYIKLFLLIVFCFPLFLFSIIGFNGQNIIYVLSYILKFVFSQKLFLYSKSYHSKNIHNPFIRFLYFLKKIKFLHY